MGAAGDETLELLSRVPLFSTLAPEELKHVAQVAVPRRFAANQVVFREGDASDTCYLIRRGHVRAVRAHMDGRTITLAQFGPGDFFGELAMLDEERRSATIETLEETEAIAILGTDMRRLLREHPDISVKLIAALGRRLRETNERLARQSFQTVQSRVASALGQLVTAARGRGRGRRGRPDHLNPGRTGPAGGLLQGVGQPVPRRSGAGGNNHPGQGKTDRSRPRCPGAVRLLARAKQSSRLEEWSSEATTSS